MSTEKAQEEAASRGEPRASHSTIRPTGATPKPEPRQPDLTLAARPSPLLRAVFARLQDEGLRVVATSPARASGRIVAEPPRLVVMDLAACAMPELVAKVHELGLPIAVLGTSMRSRSAFVARSLGARHLLSPSPSVGAITEALLACLTAEAEKAPTLDLPYETTLSELQEAVAQELRVALERGSGRSATRGDGDLRFTITSPQTLATYVRRLRAALSRSVTKVEAAPCELTGEAKKLTEPRAPAPPALPLANTRLVLVDGNVARVDAFTTVLRGAGAMVFVSSPEELIGELSRVADLDPTALLVEEHFSGMARRLIEDVARESRLRFCPMLELPLAEMWSPSERSVDGARIIEVVREATSAERELVARLVDETTAAVPLDTLGPARLLHAVASAGIATRISHFEGSCLTRIDFAPDGILAGIKMRLPNRETLEGPLALAAFLRRSTGEARMERLPEASIVNLLAPVADCLALAAEESPPVIEAAEDGNLPARLQWSMAPGAAAGNVTWSNIPAMTPEMLRQYAVTSPLDLLDAVDGDEPDEAATRVQESTAPPAPSTPPGPASSAPPAAPTSARPPAPPASRTPPPSGLASAFDLRLTLIALGISGLLLVIYYAVYYTDWWR